ncbi:unnamed protein product [Boreogadus saida]
MLHDSTYRHGYEGLRCRLNLELGVEGVWACSALLGSDHISHPELCCVGPQVSETSLGEREGRGILMSRSHHEQLSKDG